MSRRLVRTLENEVILCFDLKGASVCDACPEGSVVAVNHRRSSLGSVRLLSVSAVSVSCVVVGAGGLKDELVRHDTSSNTSPSPLPCRY
eukprot:scaffold34752_cov52-Attheya_sp.AAC.3